VIVIDIEMVTVIIIRVATEVTMMTENDLVCVQEVEVQEVIKTVIDMVIMVVEIGQEIVWVEEIDTKKNMLSPPFPLYSFLY
jgi:hypothetical protein